MSPPSLFLLACLIASASSLPLASRDRDFALRHTKGGKSAADAAAVGPGGDQAGFRREGGGGGGGRAAAAAGR